MTPKQNERIENAVYDLGIRYNTLAFQEIFCGHKYPWDAPKELFAILKQTNGGHAVDKGVHELETIVRWGRGRAQERVCILFGKDGNLKLSIGDGEFNSRYSPKAVAAISRQVVVILNCLRNFKIIDNWEVTT
jgi:hypothetical protein